MNLGVRPHYLKVGDQVLDDHQRVVGILSDAVIRDLGFEMVENICGFFYEIDRYGNEPATLVSLCRQYLKGEIAKDVLAKELDSGYYWMWSISLTSCLGDLAVMLTRDVLERSKPHIAIQINYTVDHFLGEEDKKWVNTKLLELVQKGA